MSTSCLRIFFCLFQTHKQEVIKALMQSCSVYQSSWGGCFGALGIWKTSPSTTVFLCLCLPKCFSGSLETNTITSHWHWTLFVLFNVSFPYFACIYCHFFFLNHNFVLLNSMFTLYAYSFLLTFVPSSTCTSVYLRSTVWGKLN